MEELMNEIEEHIMKHLEIIHVDLENKGHFVSSQQLDDCKDCLVSLWALKSVAGKKSMM